ncbi:MAG: M20/M25/M40 family metallo-hydrolase, partial [Thermoplasmata archaeon]
MRGVPAPVVVLLLLVPGAGATFQERAMEAGGQPGGLHSIPIYFDVPLAPGSGVRQEPSTKLFTVPPPEVQAAIKGLTCQVSQDHLRRYLTTLQEFGTRFCAAPQMALATRWLHDTLDRNGRLQVSFHNFTYQGQVNTYLMSSVILTLPGLNTSSDAVYYFYAHSDSVSQDYWNNAPGADDDGSGCVAVLEAARILSRYDFQDTIKFCFFTAEEIGLVGSGRYVESIHSMGENVQGGICYDMVGSSYAGGTYDFNLAWDPASAPQGRYMVGVNERYGIGLRIDTYQYPAGQGAPTDVTRFWQHGYPGVFGIEEDFSPYYHSTMDRVEYINFTLVQRATMLAIASLAEMARFMYVDLSIPPDGLRLSSERPEEGEDVEISVNVTNTGNLNATDVDVEFYLDGLPIAARRVDVPAGATSSTEARWKAAVGTHRVTVEIDPRNNVVESDESNNTAERFVEVNDKPVAFLSASPLSVLTQEEVRFEGGSSVDAIGGVSEYSFDFGDGSGTGWTPSARAAHSYGNDGVYTASLRVRDALGSVSGPSRINITVLNRAPSASPSANSTRALTLVPIKFFSNASDQDGSVTVRWSFGDGCETD